MEVFIGIVIVVAWSLLAMAAFSWRDNNAVIDARVASAVRWRAMQAAALWAVVFVAIELYRAPEPPSDGPWWWRGCGDDHCVRPWLRDYMLLGVTAFGLGFAIWVITGWLLSERARARHEMQGGTLEPSWMELRAALHDIVRAGFEARLVAFASDLRRELRRVPAEGVLALAVVAAHRLRPYDGAAMSCAVLAEHLIYEKWTREVHVFVVRLPASGEGALRFQIATPDDGAIWNFELNGRVLIGAERHA
jgi:hypothetical protein